MTGTILEIARFRCKKVSFYTVHVEGRKRSEFADFIERMEVRCPTQVGELMKFIEEIGDKFGAKTDHFRPEKNAFALPPLEMHLQEDPSEETSKYGLRLYCCRYNSEAVMLYNGDLKTQQTAQECPQVSKHLAFAIKATAKIDTALQEKDILFIGRKIQIHEDFNLEL